MVAKNLNCPICFSIEAREFCTALDSLCEGRQWSVLKCRNCGYGWTSPLLSPDHLQAYYPPSYLGDCRQRIDGFLGGTLQKGRSWERETEKVRLVERFVAGGSLLDVGCSNAGFLLALDGSRWQKAGIEHIRPVVELVRSYFPELEVYAGDFCDARLERGRFDVITFWHVFEHLPDPLRNLQRAFELLKPGGYIFIRVPSFDSWQARFFLEHWYALDVPRHLHHFSRRSLEILLEGTGFGIQKFRFAQRRDNFHHLKHSALRWSEAKFGSRLPYYFFKPFLLTLPHLEQLVGSAGVVTLVGRKG